MENVKRTWDYLKELNAVLHDTKIVVQDSAIGDEIYIFKREYYKKCNNKICYVDYKGKYFKTDWNRIKKFNTNKIYSTGDNDWRPLHIYNTHYRFLDGYKEELIQQFLSS